MNLVAIVLVMAILSMLPSLIFFVAAIPLIRKHNKEFKEMKRRRQESGAEFDKNARVFDENFNGVSEDFESERRFWKHDV